MASIASNIPQIFPGKKTVLLGEKDSAALQGQELYLAPELKQGENGIAVPVRFVYSDGIYSGGRTHVVNTLVTDEKGNPTGFTNGKPMFVLNA